MDLDFTVVMQLIIILAALITGARVLARPFLRAILEREALIEGAQGKAALLEQEARQISAKSAAIFAEKLEEINAIRKKEVVLTRGDLQTNKHALQNAHLKRLENASAALTDYASKTRGGLNEKRSELAKLLANSLVKKEADAS